MNIIYDKSLINSYIDIHNQLIELKNNRSETINELQNKINEIDKQYSITSNKLVEAKIEIKKQLCKNGEKILNTVRNIAKKITPENNKADFYKDLEEAFGIIREQGMPDDKINYEKISISKCLSIKFDILNFVIDNYVIKIPLKYFETDLLYDDSYIKSCLDKLGDNIKSPSIQELQIEITKKQKEIDDLKSKISELTLNNCFDSKISDVEIIDEYEL